MRKFNEVNMNSEGLIYLNTNLKIHALKLRLLLAFKDYTSRLYEESSACDNNKCLDVAERKYETFLVRKTLINEEIQKKEEKYACDYILCGDLVFDNDIKVCRRKVKERFLEELAITVKQFKFE